jgi:dTDP-4-amino-4,6-dideoxygalactose transaminase
MPVRDHSNFLVFGAPLLTEDDIAAVVKTLKSGWIGTGPRVAEFEEAVRVYKGAAYAAAVSSCSAALRLSMVAAGVSEGDEVITTAMTFCATVNAIIHCGAVPVLVDIDLGTMNMTPAAVEAAITPKTRAILPVHMAGRPCDMPSLTKIAQKHDLKVIEDCAHAIESEHGGVQAGTFGDFGCLSFYVTKNVTTAEGGMILAKREDDVSRIKTLALHGMSKDAWHRFGDTGYKHYFVTEAGFKYNMTDIQAAIGIEQLKRVEEYWLRRQEIWKRYNEAFRDFPVTTPAPVEPGTRHAYHLYTIRVEEKSTGISRDKFLEAVTGEGIGVGVHYMSIPEHLFYREKYGWRPEDYPNAMTVGRQTVSLPLSPGLTDDDAGDVVRAVGKILRQE